MTILFLSATRFSAQHFKFHLWIIKVGSVSWGKLKMEEELQIEEGKARIREAQT